MLYNLLYIQSISTICAYWFIAPQHLVGQNSKRGSSRSTVEQPKLGAGGVEIGRARLRAQWLSRGVGKLLLLWVLKRGENSFLPQKRECIHHGGRELQSCLIQGQAQGDRTVGLGICQSKMLFQLTAWRGLFLPLPSHWWRIIYSTWIRLFYSTWIRPEQFR